MIIVLKISYCAEIMLNAFIAQTCAGKIGKCTNGSHLPTYLAVIYIDTFCSFQCFLLLKMTCYI